LWAVGLTTALMTSFYMWRLMYMTFYGESRSHVHAHESPKVMTVPLMALAAGSALAGWLSVPKSWGFPALFGTFEHWLGRHFGEAHGEHHVPELLLTSLSIAAGLLGIYIASRIYLKVWDGALYRTLLNKWYVDEIYNYLFVDGLAKGGGNALWTFDRNVIDGGVNGAGWSGRFGSTLTIWWDTWIVDGAVRLTGFVVKLAGYPVRLLQTGHVQSYALVFVAGVLAMLGYFVTR
jgi:NADH-quinone oxidoreductase subunit L